VDERLQRAIPEELNVCFNELLEERRLQAGLRWRALMIRIWEIVLLCALAMSQATSGTQQSDGSKETQQTQTQARPSSNPDAGIVGDNGEEPDEPVATAASNRAQAGATAWEMIGSNLKNTKPQLRIDALVAIGTLGGNGRAEEMAKTAMTDSDRDVRLAAAVAMGAMKDRSLIPALRTALDDKAPEVSYAAAVSLWKLHDRSGEPVLYGVLAGDRKASPGVVDAQMHEANKDLHSPSALAKIGAEQGAYALLGPFGIGLDAAKMMTKGSSANSARVLTANLLASDPTPTTKQQFLDALRDKNSFVRSASAKALGNYRGKDVSDALFDLFTDKKPAVRLMAAASYIRASGPPKRPSKSAQ
jgi:HEAT repeat protein